MPTVKTMTFKQGGHHASCAERRKYLEADGRHLECITHNIADAGQWDTEMDRTRAQYHLRGCVTYREFIISPDAADQATQSQVRNLALRWVTENFPNAEASIVLHNDNKERLATGRQGIVHAHVVVNSVDLETGRKIILKTEKVRELHNSLQRIGQDIGLSIQPDYIPGQRLESQQTRHITQSERQMTLRGIRCWKSAVRDMALQALDLSTTPAEFSTYLDRADVDVTVEQGHIYLTDRDNPTRSVRSDKLDSSLDGAEIMKRYGSNMLELRNLQELGEFAQILRGELQQGNEIRKEMQLYDCRCRKALDDYEKLAQSCEGMRSDKFPQFMMPKAETLAERMRQQQIWHKFRSSAQAIKRQHSVPSPAQKAAARRRNTGGHSSSSQTQQNQQQSYSRERSR